MEEKIRIVRKFNQENRYRDGGVLNNAIDDTLNELERLQKENNDLRAIKETVRYLEEEGEKDDLYYVVGRGSYLADVLNSAFNDYIPKQAIRDKLEEVNKEYKKYTEKWEKSGMNKEHPFYRYIVRLEAQIDILEELLNEVN